MSVFGPQIVDGVRQACEEGSVMAGLAFSEMLERELKFRVGSDDTLTVSNLPPELQGPGILFVLELDGVAALLVIPAEHPALPQWCDDPSLVASRFGPLSKQLRVLLPDPHRPAASWSLRVDDIGMALIDGDVKDGAARLQLLLDDGQSPIMASLIWPARAPKRLNSHPSLSSERVDYQDIEDGLRVLPPYARSLLRVRVPVSVTLANTRRTLRRILELSPGAIIQFKKSCDETLSLEIGGQAIAEGEAVKVGDKFGLWITSMTLPKERFQRVVNQAAGSPPDGLQSLEA